MNVTGGDVAHAAASASALGGLCSPEGHGVHVMYLLPSTEHHVLLGNEADVGFLCRFYTCCVP